MLVPLFLLLAAALTPPELQTLAAGRVITRVEPGNEPVHRVSAEGVVNAPPDKVWAVVTDFGNYDHVYTSIRKSSIRGKVGNTVMGYFLLDFPWPLPQRWTLNETHLDPSHKTFDWTRVDGTVKRYEGRLRLYAWGDHKTRMVFEALMDPGLSFVPGWLVDYVSVNTLPGIVQGVRDDLSRMASRPR